MKYNVMFVDTAANVLEILRWVFKDEPYDLFISESPEGALKLMRDTEFAVVLVDQDMPDMSGAELLRLVKKRSPHTAGMIMTSFIEPEIALNAIDHGYVYRFVTKPWEQEDLKEAVRMGVEHYEMTLENRRYM